MKFRFFIISIVLLQSCGNDHNRNGQKAFANNDNTLDIFFRINTNGDSLAYFQAKWLMYCLYSDLKLYHTTNNIVDDTTTIFGSLPMKLTYYERRHDTADFIFLYYYHDSIPIYKRFVKWQVHHGLSIRVPVDTVVNFLNENGDAITFGPPNDTSYNFRPYTIVDSIVINKLEYNKAKLDPWFRQEAVRRGLISN